MISYKNYKKYYGNKSFNDYFKNIILKTLVFKIKKYLKVPYNCYLCIKYPFLYPKNRFSDSHYTNWVFEEKLRELRKKFDFTPIFDENNKIILRTKENIVIKKNKYYFQYYLLKIWYFILSLLNSIPDYTEWDAVPEGWNRAFGKQFLKDLKKQLKKDNMLYEWRIMQIKEKYGTLRLYCNYGSKELYDLIYSYENKSWNYCIKCGKPMTHVSKGWISPYCSDCANKNPEEYWTLEEYNENR